ncbi:MULTISPECIES: hypothetical protein [unclassified Polaromonas]|uniref:hypothetical protein n=1 Tax=unclassified Polaromonas TaxID=2638319 RepID=UPI000F081D09|nr:MULTISPECIES: hypothetical protein [unclassified Polaromonas]AYQ27446.1 hypothetical protein DT070_05015 [Polaromonas sp. SP1]QGJ17713.1 hypothetical protein F7R28_04435 [Polaromonas sp. Pch-P]
MSLHAHSPASPGAGSPLQALQASLRPASAVAAKPRLLVAGATGVLGNEVLRRLVGSGRYAHTEVLATEAMATSLSGVGIALAEIPAPIAAWAARPLPAHTGLIMFEPPRLYYGRERTLWTPTPAQMPELARWLRRCGVQTLVVVVPHAPGRLPDALKRGLADLDEHAIASMGFERVLLVRSARKAQAVQSRNVFERTAAWMLSVLKFMIPAAEQPVRPAKLAEFVDTALAMLPPGTHVAAPELLWQANQSSAAGWGGKPGDAKGSGHSMREVVRAWLAATHNPAQNPTTDSTTDTVSPR